MKHLSEGHLSSMAMTSLSQFCTSTAQSILVGELAVNAFGGRYAIFK